MSNLLLTHKEYHCNPIRYKIKGRTFWYTICNKGVFPAVSNIKYTKAPKRYAIPDNFSIVTTWGKSS
ncbi:36248_t:CDS:1, partial [Racocetra persica]